MSDEVNRLSPSPRPVRVGRRRVAGAVDVEVRFRIVRARDPGRAGAVARGVEAGPGLESRDRPDSAASSRGSTAAAPVLGIERFQERRRVDVVAGADDDVIADDHRRVRREVLLIERRDLVLPDFLAGLGIEAHDPVVVQLEVDVVVPHAEAAGLQAGAAAGLPVVVPEQRAVARIDRVDVIGRGRVDDRRRRTECRRRAAQGRSCSRRRCRGRRRRSARPPPPPPPRPPPPPAARRRPPAAVPVGPQPVVILDHPLQTEVLDRVRIDQLQRAETLAAEVARVAGPLIRERLHHVGGIEAAALAGHQRGSERAVMSQEQDVVFFIGVDRSLHFNRPQIGGDVVHLLVLRIVELQHHLLVRVVRILDVDLWHTVVARDGFARAIWQRQDDQKVVPADQRAFQLRAVGHRHGHGIAGAAPAAAAAAERLRRARDPAVLQRSGILELRRDALQVAGH